jgi:FlaA1/EpsC-like NDP-sugar epimerase
MVSVKQERSPNVPLAQHTHIPFRTQSASSTNMSVVAVAGGTGKLGRTIVKAIVEHGEHKVVVLARTVRIHKL